MHSASTVISSILGQLGDSVRTYINVNEDDNPMFLRKRMRRDQAEDDAFGSQSMSRVMPSSLASMFPGLGVNESVVGARTFDPYGQTTRLQNDNVQDDSSDQDDEDDDQDDENDKHVYGEYIDDSVLRDAVLTGISWSSLLKGMQDWQTDSMTDTVAASRKALAQQWIQWLSVQDRCDEWPVPSYLTMDTSIRQQLRQSMEQVTTLCDSLLMSSSIPEPIGDDDEY